MWWSRITVLLIIGCVAPAKDPNPGVSNREKSADPKAAHRSATTPQWPQPPPHRAAVTQNHTDLCSTVLNKRFADVRTLLEQGANPNEHNPTGITPLMCAAHTGNAAIAKLLLQWNADPNRTNIYGDRAINFSRSHRAIENLLLQRGSLPAHASSIDRITATIRDFYPSYVSRRSPAQLRRFVRHSLFTAKRFGLRSERDVLHYTLARLVFGIQVTTSRKYRWVRRSLLRSKWTQPRRLARFQRQLRKRDLAAKGEPFSRRAPITLPERLHAAAKANQPQRIKRLLGLGLPVDTVDAYHRTAAFYAACAGHEQAIAMLLHAKADVHRQDTFGNSALHCAAQHGRHGVAKRLLDQGANPTTRNAATPQCFRPRAGIRENRCLASRLRRTNHSRSTANDPTGSQPGCDIPTTSRSRVGRHCADASIAECSDGK